MAETELLELFEAARNAADAAEKDANPAEVDRCVDAIRRLRDVPVTVKVLVDTQVGKKLRSHLTKHSIKKIQKAASELCDLWKKKVIEETTKKKESNGSNKDLGNLEAKPERTETIKMQKPGTATGTGSRSNTAKIEENESNGRVKVEKISKSESFKIEKTKMEQRSSVNGTFTKESVKVEKNTMNEKCCSTANQPSFAINQPPRLTSMLKCNDAVRDKNRELFADALSKVFSEAQEEIREEVEACDPIRVAVTLESVMFEKLGRSSGAHKQKYRSILFNLKDNNNPDLRRRVLLGHIKPEVLINMTAEDMASDERKLQNKQIKEKALFECERANAPKASTDQFKCGRCGQRKCTYYQLQTRSADEPMTTFVTCVNCNNHWKFC